MRSHRRVTVNLPSHVTVAHVLAAMDDLPPDLELISIEQEAPDRFGYSPNVLIFQGFARDVDGTSS